MRWLQLIRLPTIFTAMADIFLGFLVVSGGVFAPVPDFLLLLGASGCLYFAGMVFNDVFDLPRDAVERPERPIPSGAVSLRAASILGAVLCVAGVLLAAFVSTWSVVVAISIVAAVLAYDWLLKQTVLAPVAMGSCRFLNVILGASTAAQPLSVPQVVLALGLGIYIAGLTWFARREAVGDNRRDLIGGAVVMNLAILGLAGFVALKAGARSGQIAGLLVFLLAVIDVRLWQAIRVGSPPLIGAGIRAALLSLVLIDASLVLAFTESSAAAVSTAALLLPASVIRRWIPMT